MNETTTLPLPTAIRKTHWAAHPDEIATKVLEEKVGGDISELQFVMNAGAASNEDKATMIGAGGGVSDEHVNGGGLGRRENSAFTLTAKARGLENEPKIRELSKFLDRVDSGAGSDAYDLSKITQAIHRANPGSSQEGADWCRQIILSYWDDADYLSRPAIECGILFNKIGCIWLGSRFGGQKINDLIKRFFADKIEMTFNQAITKVGKTQDQAVMQMSRFFQNNCERMLQPFALPRCIASVNATKGIRSAVKLAIEALDAKLLAEQSFQKAKQEVAVGGETFRAGRFQVYRTTTASKNVKDAILNSRKEISVIMQKNFQSGSVQIFSRASSGVRFEELAAAIRLEELKLEGKATDDLFEEELKGAGNTCGVMNWFLIVRRQEGGAWKGSYMLLNGSDSYLNVPKTRISWDRLKEIVIDVLGRQR